MISSAPLLLAQDATYPPPKPSPPKIASQVFVIAESVVQTQWPHTLKLVNAPQNLTLLNPGQCIRAGIYVTGDKRDEFLAATKLSLRVQLSGHAEAFSSSPVAEWKQIKPEGGDFVTAALGAAGVKQPESLKTMASLGISKDHWCVPENAADGTATVSAEVDAPSGHQTLSSSAVSIESFDSGSKKTFKSDQELGAFLQDYYRQPNPARLIPALQFLVATEEQHPRQGQIEIAAAFMSAALGSDPIAARDFQTRVALQSPLTRALGLAILRSAGHDISPVLNAMSPEEKSKFASLPALRDPFDLTPTQALFQHLDMLWAVFGATGQFKPVQTIASALGWKSDYEELQKFRSNPNHPSALTPSLIRGVTYTAAGWSLWSFQRNDTLVADYIDYLLASPDTPQTVKTELMGLGTNPAFKQPGGE
jgi:hypothetical protein